MHIERIHPDPAFWEEALVKATRIFQVAILPELVGRWFTRPNASVTTSDENEPDDEEGPFCYCQEYIEDSELHVIMTNAKLCGFIWSALILNKHLKENGTAPHVKNKTSRTFVIRVIYIDDQNSIIS